MLGDKDTVFDAVVSHLDGTDVVYMTSRGETGLYKRYHELVGEIQRRGVLFCPLGADKRMLVPGSPWAEISIHPGDESLAVAAIEEARHLNIVPIASITWGDFEQDHEEIGRCYRVDAVLLRALREEGRSEKSGGISKVWQLPGADLRGWKPMRAYRGLEDLDGYDPTCIDSFGEIVPVFVP